MTQALPIEVSHVLKKYEAEFFNVVDAKYNLLRLNRKMVIDDGLMAKIESTNNETAKELLFKHLKSNANVVALREYCKIIIEADGFPKMQKLGMQMLRELPPEEAPESGDSSHIGTEHPLQEQGGRNPSAVQSLIKQFQKAEMDGKPDVHSKPARTYRSAPVVCQLPEPCVQDDEQLQMMAKNLDKLSKEDLFQLLSQKVDTDTAQKFWEHRMSGANLIDLTSDELKEIVSLVGPRKDVQSIITDFKRTAQTEVALHGVDGTCVPMASKEIPQLNSRATSVVKVLGTPSPSEKLDSQADFSAPGQCRTIPGVQFPAPPLHFPNPCWSSRLNVADFDQMNCSHLLI